MLLVGWLNRRPFGRLLSGAEPLSRNRSRAFLTIVTACPNPGSHYCDIRVTAATALRERTARKPGQSVVHAVRDRVTTGNWATSRGLRSRKTRPWHVLHPVSEPSSGVCGDKSIMPKATRKRLESAKYRVDEGHGFPRATHSGNCAPGRPGNSPFRRLKDQLRLWPRLLNGAIAGSSRTRFRRGLRVSSPTIVWPSAANARLPACRPDRGAAMHQGAQPRRRPPGDHRAERL